MKYIKLTRVTRDLNEAGIKFQEDYVAKETKRLEKEYGKEDEELSEEDLREIQLQKLIQGEDYQEEKEEAVEMMEFQVDIPYNLDLHFDRIELPFLCNIENVVGFTEQENWTDVAYLSDDFYSVAEKVEEIYKLIAQLNN